MLHPLVSSFSLTCKQQPCYFSTSVTNTDPEGGDFLSRVMLKWFAIFKSVKASSRIWFQRKTLRVIQNSISSRTGYNYFRSSRNLTFAECSFMEVYSSPCCMKNGHKEPFGIFLSTGDLCDVTFYDWRTEMVNLQLTFKKKKPSYCIKTFWSLGLLLLFVNLLGQFNQCLSRYCYWIFLCSRIQHST